MELIHEIYPSWNKSNVNSQLLSQIQAYHFSNTIDKIFTIFYIANPRFCSSSLLLLLLLLRLLLLDIRNIRICFQKYMFDTFSLFVLKFIKGIFWFSDFRVKQLLTIFWHIVYSQSFDSFFFSICIFILFHTKLIKSYSVVMHRSLYVGLLKHQRA